MLVRAIISHAASGSLKLTRILAYTSLVGQFYSMAMMRVRNTVSSHEAQTGSRTWLLVSLMLAIALAAQLGREYLSKSRPVQDQASLGPDLLREISEVSRSLSQDVGRSVVRVEVRRADTVTTPVTPSSQEAGGQVLEGQASDGQGSGVIVSDDQLILTNYHVVADAESITLAANGVECTGTLLGSDPLTDLALLRASEKLGPSVQWGDSSALAVGDFVWAIGNPFGLERSVTFGIVSAIQQKGIAENPFQDFFQTDAAVNPGNSGGPVVNGLGKVVGINSAIVGESYRGISFAIPSNTARDVLRNLRNHGRVPRGWLGVKLVDLSIAKATNLGLSHTRGALVESLPGDPVQSPARAAGLAVDDVVVSWNGVDVSSSTQLGRLVGQTALGSIAKMGIWRQGQELTLDVTLGERR